MSDGVCARECCRWVGEWRGGDAEKIVVCNVESEQRRQDVESSSVVVIPSQASKGRVA